MSDQRTSFAGTYGFGVGGTDFVFDKSHVFEYESINDFISANSTVRVPWILRISNLVFFVGTVFFSLEFLLSFVGKNIVSFPYAVIFAINFGGLLKVFARAEKIIKNKTNGVAE